MNALLLGRYQLFHKGHMALVDKAIEECDNVLLFIGSSQEEGTIANPFSYALRKRMIQAIYQDKVMIKPLADLGVGNVPAWGDYVYDNAHKYLDKVDRIYLGDEVKHASWYTPSHKEETQFRVVSRLDIPISASMIREAILRDDKDFFCQYVDKRLYSFYEELQAILVRVYNGQVTKK